MFRKLGLLCAVLALFSLAGGHRAALQTVAWAKMFYAHARDGENLAAAAAETFDGRHPCELCRRIAAERSREHQEKPDAPGLEQDAKAKAVLATSVFRPAERPASAGSLLREAPRPSSLWADSPPTPPPRDAQPAA